MRLPAIKSDPHPLLFPLARDKSHPTIGSRRTVIGNYCEALMSSLLGLPLRDVDSRCDVCPDLIDEEKNIAHEVKGMKFGNGKVLWYEHATNAYDRMEREGWRVFVWCCRWKANLNGCHFTSEFRERLSAPGVWEVAVIQFRSLLSFCTPEKRFEINTGFRSSANRTGWGWAIPAKNFFTANTLHLYPITAFVGERAIGGIPLFINHMDTLSTLELLHGYRR